MDEKRWASSLTGTIQQALDRVWESPSTLVVKNGYRLPYAFEISKYNKQEPDVKQAPYETDILICEQWPDDTWKPRVVVEVKVKGINTHDAITYSQKASAHKNVHPYLRYGILLGGVNQTALPGRLFRHGSHFDFMLSWQHLKPSRQQFKDLINLILSEVNTSRTLEQIIFESRKQNRTRYTYLHRKLIVEP